MIVFLFNLEVMEMVAHEGFALVSSGSTTRACLNGFGLISIEVEEALHQCISIFQEYATHTLLSFPQVKNYPSCLNYLLNLALEQIEDGNGKPNALQGAH
ncbi:hypothetical protein HPP92_002022 [Vanilla planifolia]|uniref:Uncharacterized protein n=1 Tax=Vanilla planifolia TaxID=51239 RepID=A0A835S0F1_VANPL|nr:hypothetical protein HPP92_002022 [Vanilla planifolia]